MNRQAIVSSNQVVVAHPERSFTDTGGKYVPCLVGGKFQNVRANNLRELTSAEKLQFL